MNGVGEGHDTFIYIYTYILMYIYSIYFFYLCSLSIKFLNKTAKWLA